MTSTCVRLYLLFMGLEDRPAGSGKLWIIKDARPDIGKGKTGSVEQMQSTIEAHGQEVITLCHQFPNRADPSQLNIWISTGASAASFILCAAVLGAAGWVWSYPHFRMYLDRVSFRLLLWSMVFELAYDVAYIAVELYVSRPTNFGLMLVGRWLLGCGVCV